MKYYGVFNKIKNGSLEIYESNIYDDYFAKFYKKLCHSKNKDEKQYDIDFYIEKILSINKPIRNVLELGCGTGRVTIPLLKKGIKVTGIDLSYDMLQVLREDVSKLPNRYKGNLQTKHMSILEMDWHEEFDVVIFPATTICLLEDDEREVLLEKVYDALKCDGIFIFDYAVENVGSGFQELEMNVVKFSENECCFIQEFKDYENKENIVNFYSEKEEDKKFNRYISSTIKRMTFKSDIENIITKSSFNKEHIQEIQIKDVHNGDVIFTILKK